MADVTPLVRDELLPPKPPERRHLISIADLSRDDVERLLTLAGAAFFWAVDNDQYDDMDTPALMPLTGDADFPADAPSLDSGRR